MSADKGVAHPGLLSEVCRASAAQGIDVQGGHIEALTTRADMVTFQVRFQENTLMSRDLAVPENSQNP